MREVLGTASDVSSVWSNEFSSCTGGSKLYPRSWLFHFLKVFQAKVNPLQRLPKSHRQPGNLPGAARGGAARGPRRGAGAASVGAAGALEDASGGGGLGG